MSTIIILKKNNFLKINLLISIVTKNVWDLKNMFGTSKNQSNRQLGFVTLNGNLAVNLKPTYPPLLNGKGQFTFLKTKSSHSSGIVVNPPKFEFLRK